MGRGVCLIFLYKMPEDGQKGVSESADMRNAEILSGKSACERSCLTLCGMNEDGRWRSGRGLTGSEDTKEAEPARRETAGANDPEE